MQNIFSQTIVTGPLTGDYGGDGYLWSLAEDAEGDLWVALGSGQAIKLPADVIPRLIDELIKRFPPADNPIPFVSSEVETPQAKLSGIITDPRETMRGALLGAMPALKLKPQGDMNQLVDAACAAYGRHQTGEAYGLPPYEPPTCGTGHLIAERTLRLLDKGTPFDALPGGDAIQELATLVEQAGVGFAREWLVRNSPQPALEDRIPF